MPPKRPPLSTEAIKALQQRFDAFYVDFLRVAGSPIPLPDRERRRIKFRLSRAHARLGEARSEVMAALELFEKCEAGPVAAEPASKPQTRRGSHDSD